MNHTLITTPLNDLNLLITQKRVLWVTIATCTKQ